MSAVARTISYLDQNQAPAALSAIALAEEKLAELFGQYDRMHRAALGIRAQRVARDAGHLGAGRSPALGRPVAPLRQADVVAGERLLREPDRGVDL